MPFNLKDYEYNKEPVNQKEKDNISQEIEKQLNFLPKEIHPSIKDNLELDSATGEYSPMYVGGLTPNKKFFLYIPNDHNKTGLEQSIQDLISKKITNDHINVHKTIPEVAEKTLRDSLSHFLWDQNKKTPSYKDLYDYITKLNSAAQYWRTNAKNPREVHTYKRLSNQAKLLHALFQERASPQT